MARPGRGSDQFPLRLPDGLRDRIKEAAERKGRSMNAEIVRVLLDEFPEPFPLQHRIEDLLHLFAALQKLHGYERAIDALTEQVLEASEAVASGRVPSVDDATRQEVREALVARQLDRIAKVRERRTSIDTDQDDI